MRIPRSPTRLAAVLCALALSPLLAPRAGLAAPAGLPVAGVEPLAQVAKVEARSVSLVHWLGAGVRDAALVHVDVLDGLSAIAPERLAALRELAARGDDAGLRRAASPGSGRLVTGRSLLRAAAALGAVREIVWIVPDVFPPDDSSTPWMRDALAAAGVGPADLATLAARDGGYALRCEGVAVRIVPLERLPQIAGPVLLNIDAAAVPMLARARGVSALAGVRALVGRLADQRYAVAAAVVASPVEEGLLPMRLRWVVDVLVDALRDPRLLSGAEPPTLWEDYQRLTWLIDSPDRHGRVDTLYKAAASEERSGQAAALAYLSAEALLVSGEYPRALEYATEACRRDAGYCLGLQELGVQLLEHREEAAAQVFFDVGEQLRPGMLHALLDRGLALVRLGKPEAARAPFATLFAVDGDFVSGFVAGALEVQLADRAAARRYFDAALAALPAGPLKRPLRSEIIASLVAAETFYREEGLEREALRLEAALGRPAAPATPITPAAPAAPVAPVPAAPAR